MFEYKIIRVKHFDKLEPAINEAIKDGWQLHGDVQTALRLHVREPAMDGDVMVETDHFFYYWLTAMCRIPQFEITDAQKLISYRR